MNMKKIIKTLIIGSALALVLCATAMAGDLADGACKVTASTLNIRATASTSSSIITTVNNGTILVVLDDSTSGWYYVAYGSSRGYVSRDYVSFDSVENFTAVGRISDQGGARLREKPNSSAEAICVGLYGDQVNIIGINKGWYKVKYGQATGYIRSDLITIVGTTTSSSSTSGSGSSGSSSSTTTYSSVGAQVAAYAQQFVGYRYVYGGKSPSSGFDCSGLVYYVYKQFGYTLTPGATTQYKSSVGYVINKSDLQPGDLVFFSANGSSISHIGIYIGNDQFVHASTPSTGVIISSLSSSYYTAHYYSAKRIVG
jgi:cell wall-associated NlpC family hydrolase